MKKLFLLVVVLTALPMFGIAPVTASKTVCVQTTTATTATCTLTASTTAGNSVKVGLSWKATAARVNSVTAPSDPTQRFFQYGPTTCSASSCAAIFVCPTCGAITNIKPTFSASSLFTMNVDEYSGVGSIGIANAATGTSTAPSVTLTTSDANNYIVVQTASLGNAGIPTAGTGNLRTANRTGTTSSNVAGAACDNTVVAAGSVTCSVTITSGVWAATAIELRTVPAPTSYQWPNCDASHPCLIHSKATTSNGVGSGGESDNGFKVRFQPSKANNTGMLVVHRLTTRTVTIADDQANAWGSPVVSTVDAGNGYTTDLYVKCGLATGTSELTLTFSSALIGGDIVQFWYSEWAGVPTTSCTDGSSGANALNSATLQPGSITTAASGDVIVNYAIEGYPYTQSEVEIGPLRPRPAAALIMQNIVDKFGASVEFQAAAGAIDPIFYNTDQFGRGWNSVAVALKSSPGTGTLPSGIHVVHINHFFYPNDGDLVTANGQVKVALPSTGNLQIITTTNASDSYAMSNIKDAAGNTYTRTGFDALDGQIFYSCSATPSTQNTYGWTSQNIATHWVSYDIAGARTGGPTACYDTRVSATGSGVPPGVDITNAPTITPSTANGVIIAVMPLGTGPPSAPIGAGQIFVSVWATGMLDTSNFDTGDGFSYYYNPDTAAYSFGYHMAGALVTEWNGLAAAFMAPAPAAGGTKRRVVVSQ